MWWWSVAVIVLLGLAMVAFLLVLVEQAPVMEETRRGLTYWRPRLRRPVLKWLGRGLEESLQRPTTEPVPPELAAVAERIVSPFEIWEALASPIDTAPKKLERTLLLYCPEQGGWQTGRWVYESWRSTTETELNLGPTHWANLPPDPTSG